MFFKRKKNIPSALLIISHFSDSFCMMKKVSLLQRVLNKRAQNAAYIFRIRICDVLSFPRHQKEVFLQTKIVEKQEWC